VAKWFIRRYRYRYTRLGDHSGAHIPNGTLKPGSGSERSSIARVLGYIWVPLWFTVTAPLLLDPAKRAGFNKERMFPAPLHPLLSNFLFDGSV
jgi:hypothetical protein